MKTALLRRDYAVRSAHWFALLPGDSNRTVATQCPGMALPFPPMDQPRQRRASAASAHLSGSRSGSVQYVHGIDQTECLREKRQGQITVLLLCSDLYLCRGFAMLRRARHFLSIYMIINKLAHS